MESMEVDPIEVIQGDASGHPQVAVTGQADDTDPPLVILDSGSSTEVDDDEDDSNEAPGAAQAPPRLPATWAFSQRAVGRTATRGAPIRRRLRYKHTLTNNAWFVSLIRFNIKMKDQALPSGRW